MKDVFMPGEDDVAAAETHSQSSHEPDHCDDDDDDDDDDASLNSNNEVNDDAAVPFWRQHWPAMMIALIASVAGQCYSRNFSIRDDGRPLFSFLEHSPHTHAHVDNFRRTANISFCNENMGSYHSSLEWMDFYIPLDYFETLASFFQADEIEDDYYTQTPSELQRSQPNDPDFQCLWEQKQRPHASGKFRGTTYYYRSPTIEEMYPEPTDVAVGVSNVKSRQRRLQQPPLVFTGFAAKFVNLSPKPVLLYWDGKGGSANARKLVGEIGPFESLGTATFPGNSFHVTPVYDSSTALQRWVMTADTALVYYEPQTPLELKDILLASSETPDYVAWGKYQKQLVNQAFARDYLIASKRIWLAHFPRRFPHQHMHPAGYIGQVHTVGEFQLEVVSVTPRVLIIDNFLSPEDCKSIIVTSRTQGLEHSTLHQGATTTQTRDLSTRSSSNTWLPRDTNELTERIYQQAAQVMQIDPELFQKYHDSSPHHHSIAESLQIVRYKKGGEEYQPHHDFIYPSINHRYQPTRFATLLMYLNDVPEGGETRFPRAVNNYSAQGLEVKPKAGRAVLFYNMLEDGNVDDLSQHGSNPTTDYEKWLANLWVWDPIID